MEILKGSFESEKELATNLALSTYNASMVGTSGGPSWGVQTPEGFFMAATIECPNGIHSKAGQFAKPVFACDHCTQQDPVHPDGIILTEKGFFVCQKCFDRMNSHRNWKFWQDLKTHCQHCIQDEIARIKSIDPTLFRDIMNESAGGRGIIT